ncbi:DUF4136 domain-containing protein [Flammeovirgaceae bacterium SG7u.111]|nr:DUF4136 domain-containing protein [Flammeovirgaceae bacterium SG7u.132]WPO34366.1 DUF4136 domain-containing protein [Flammeovirgaceae bacterium SG7u.111]
MKLFYPFILLFSSLIIASCSSVKVTSDSDKTTDFSKYQTYSFLGWQKESDKILNDFDKKRMREAFKEEFQKRNLKYVEKGGDMAVSLFLVVNKETSTTAYTDYYGGYGGRYRYGSYGWGMGMGSSTTTYSESDYLKGTMVMDVFDEKAGELIWQGVATKTVEENSAKREKSIPKAVTALMSKFPIQPVK